VNAPRRRLYRAVVRLVMTGVRDAQLDAAAFGERLRERMAALGNTEAAQEQTLRQQAVRDRWLTNHTGATK
jgi:hypothetical protein